MMTLMTMTLMKVEVSLGRPSSDLRSLIEVPHGLPMHLLQTMNVNSEGEKQKLFPSTVGHREWKVLGARRVQGQLVRHLHRWDQGAHWSWLSTHLDPAFPGRGDDDDLDDVL